MMHSLKNRNSSWIRNSNLKNLDPRLKIIKASPEFRNFAPEFRRNFRGVPGIPNLRNLPSWLTPNCIFDIFPLHKSKFFALSFLFPHRPHILKNQIGTRLCCVKQMHSNKG
jgi:hypothetical protein